MWVGGTVGALIRLVGAGECAAALSPRQPCLGTRLLQGPRGCGAAPNSIIGLCAGQRTPKGYWESGVVFLGVVGDRGHCHLSPCAPQMGSMP